MFRISYDTEGNKNVIQRVENIDNSIQWTIDNFPGGTEQILHIKVFENTTQFLKKLPPIRFNTTSFTIFNEFLV